MMSQARWPILVALGALFLLFGCDDPAPKKNPFDPPKDAPVKPPPVTEVTKPKGPTELSVDNMSPKIGFSRVLLQKPTDREKLKNEIATVRSEFEGKETVLSVDSETPTPSR
ncbi:MAG: hypothetical protein QM784_03680 [Polyangiaceae bacterium]